MQTPFDLQRFTQAQASVYAHALEELQAGCKQGHWMWFIFPQLRGLGRSDMAHRYGISGAAEAVAYLAHPLLGPRLKACCAALQKHKGQDAAVILGDTDALKLRSCLTLFARASQGDPEFVQLLADYFDSVEDPKTLELLAA